MKRTSIVCRHCNSEDFEVTYRGGSVDNSWNINLECNNCGHITLVALTPKEDRSISLVNEKRNFYSPMTKEN